MVTVKQLPRTFLWSGLTLKDPNPGLSPKEVRDLFSITYPGLTTAEVGEPTEKNGTLAFEFIKATGTKG